MIDEYFKTLAAPTAAELKEKGSRFRAQAAPVADKEKAEDILMQIAKKYHDASHHCFAFQVGIGDKSESRFSDDGEPSGTAGKPILQAINGLGLTNVIIVVTRYFGGTKLGTGGLIRAYGGVAALALNAATILTHFLQDTLKLECDYHDLKAILNIVQKFGGTIKSSDYGGTVRLKVEIRIGRTTQFISTVVDITAGRVVPLNVEHPR